MTEIDWKARAKAAEASTASLLEEVETLKTALRQWHCPSCGGSKVYVNRSRERGNEMVPCKVCAQTGLNAVARQVLSDLPRSPGVESVFAAADANQPAPKMPIRLDVFQVLSDWRNIVREGDIIGLDPVADPFIDRLFALFSHPAADANREGVECPRPWSISPYNRCDVECERGHIATAESPEIAAALVAMANATAPAQGDVAGLVEAVARAISLVHGQDADEDAPLSMICGAANEPMPWWRYYEEDAVAAVEALSAIAASLIKEAGDE